MTTEEKATAYAERYEARPMAETAIRAYINGATEALASQWRSVEDELPEDDRLVLAHFSDVDPELSYATAYYSDGAWQTPDDWYYDCKIDFWKPIIPPSLPDTNTEKK